MILSRVMIAITSLVWIGYGLWAFVNPAGMDYSGLAQPNWSATVEIVAMYGLFELALGLWTTLGLLRPERYRRPVMLLWAMLYSALVIGRIYGIIRYGGTFAISFGGGGLPESYNAGAMYGLELPSAVLLWIALWRTRDAGVTGIPADPAPVDGVSQSVPTVQESARAGWRRPAQR